MTVVFGWSGAGKTTLVEGVRRFSKNIVVVEDDGVTDLIASLEEAHDSNSRAHIVIEADSVLEPIAVAELFYLEGEQGEPPDDRFEIRTVATVVSASSLFPAIENPKSLLELDLQLDEGDERTNADVMVEQIEFSDVIVMNRIDDLDSEIVAKTKTIIEWLNPRAQILEVPADGMTADFIQKFQRACTLIPFDIDETPEGAGWLQILANSHPKLAKTEKLSAIAIRARRPLHPARFKDFLENVSSYGIIRVKGWIWIATRNGEVGVWNGVGPSYALESAGAWMAATPMREWPEDPGEREEIMADWVPPYGDRGQEIAILGFELNDLELRRAFRACMLTDEEFAAGPETWAKWSDPLPDWSVEGGEDFDGVLQ